MSASERALAEGAVVRGPFLSTAGAAAYCGMAVQSFRNLLAADDGPDRMKNGRLNVFLTEDLDAWMSRRLTRAASAKAVA